MIILYFYILQGKEKDNFYIILKMKILFLLFIFIEEIINPK